MKVQIHASDTGGCGYYRMIWPGREVAKQTSSLQVEVLLPDSEKSALDLMMQQTPEGPRVHSLVEPPDCDVIVLQRPLRRTLADAIPHLQAAGVAVVVELDDYFGMIHPDNAAYRRVQVKWNPERNLKHLERACHLADLVTVSTPKLAEAYGRHGRVAVLPNYLHGPSWERVDPAPQGAELVKLGWSGTIASHPNDLQQAGSFIRAALAQPHVQLHVVGDGTLVRDRLGLPDPDTSEEEPYPMKASGWVPIEEYPQAIADLHAGFVPLQLSPFNEAKSSLKGMEMAAGGVPFVASPTGPYRDLCDVFGIGLCARKPRDWAKHLRRITQEHGWRADRAAAWRERVLADFVISEHAELWEMAWTEARVNRITDRNTVSV